MIYREWHALVEAGKEQTYLNHLQEETFPKLKTLDGFIQAFVLRRPEKKGTYIKVTTVWESVESIRAFAGAEETVAVVPETAQRMMISFEPHATHYELAAKID